MRARPSTLHHGVHPRVCGGAPSSADVAATAPRVHPRVCGGQHAPSHRRCRPAHVGSIPACAGGAGGAEDVQFRSIPACANRLRRPFRPRVCGATAVRSSPAQDGEGSSPACGAEGPAAASRYRTEGLSPRVRGAPDVRRPRHADPAWAYPRVCGSLPRAGAAADDAVQSPRVRGEPDLTPCRLPLHGVHPRVCGGVQRPPKASDASGSIPACAGGILQPFLPGRRAILGLSPRVRGAAERQTGGRLGRPSPACAGEPRQTRLVPVSPRAYPRVCGGASGSPGSAATITGLSPRVRGSRYRSRGDRS